jgi:hypothetical protein
MFSVMCGNRKKWLESRRKLIVKARENGCVGRERRGKEDIWED